MNWLEFKRAQLVRLADRYGPEWVEEHRLALEGQWRIVCDLEGLNPRTGKPLGGPIGR